MFFFCKIEWVEQSSQLFSELRFWEIAKNIKSLQRKSLKSLCVVIAKSNTTKSILVVDKDFSIKQITRISGTIYRLSLHNLLSEIRLFILNGFIKTCSQQIKLFSSSFIASKHNKFSPFKLSNSYVNNFSHLL